MSSRLFKRISTVVGDFRDAAPKPQQRLPKVIQFPINDICNSQCQMCNIWQQKRDFEMSAEETRRILSNPLFREVRSVGINGGEPTLRRDIGEIVEAVVTTLPKLSGVSLITNAIQPKRIKTVIAEISRLCKVHGVHFDVMVSLDGVGSVHDRVRGRKGNFDSAIEVLDFLRDSDVGSFRIGCTIIKENVFDVEDLLHWCQNRNIYARFRVGIPHRRLYSHDTVDPFALDSEARFHLANFLDHLYLHYEKDESRRAFYRSLRDQIIYGLPRTAGCAWKSKGVTLTSRGELAFCAVESKMLGSALNEDSEDLYWTNGEHLQKIVSTKCDTCLHDYEGVSDRGLYVRSLALRLFSRSPRMVRSVVKPVRRQYVAFKQRNRVRLLQAQIAAKKYV